MSETSLEKTESSIPANSDATEPGRFEVEEVTETAPVMTPAPSADVIPVPPAAQQRSNRSATIEHFSNGYKSWFPLSGRLTVQETLFPPG